MGKNFVLSTGIRRGWLRLAAQSRGPVAVLRLDSQVHRRVLAMTALPMLMHEVIRRELTAARLARIVVQRRALLPSARPVPLGHLLLPRCVQDPAESDGTVARCDVQDCV